MKSIINTIQDEIVQELESHSQEGFYAYDNIPEGVFSLLAASAYKQFIIDSKENMLIVLESNQKAKNMTEELATLLGEQNLVFLPSLESIPYDYSSVSADLSIERIRSLYTIINSKNSLLIVTSIGNMIRKLPSKERLLALQFTIKKGDVLAPDKQAQKLVALGYKRKPQVETPGDFSLRGDILDVFNASSQFPVRLEYFDDEIEKIKEFDLDSQLSFQDVDEVLICPAGEFVLDLLESRELQKVMHDKERSLPQWMDLLNEENEVFLNQFDHSGLQELFSLVSDLSSFVDYFSTSVQLLLFNPSKIHEVATRIEYEYTRSYTENEKNHICAPVESLLSDFHKRIIEPTSFNAHPLYIFPDPRFSHELPDDLKDFENHSSQNLNQEEQIDSQTNTEEKNAFDPFYHISSTTNPFFCRALEGFNGKISETRQKMIDMARKGVRVCITSPFESQVMRISQVFKSEREIELVVLSQKPSPKKQKPSSDKVEIYVLQSPIPSGFFFEKQEVMFLTDTEFFGKSYKRKNKFKKLASAPIDSFLDLKEGDFIVHVNHGVGRFVKLEKVKAAGRERDFLIIEYAGQDRLYVPLDQISLVQRYIAPTEKPRLDNLGNKTFKKVRERVEKKIEEFAEDLIELYAARMSQQGYQFPVDTVWQDEFEALFPYEETPDQMMAIESVKHDMESLRPMDRLVCGDVGFGKTEVAIRATFKASMAGRQVAIIAPTTILAMQHFRNFSNRFQDYPISVDWLSRFRTQKESKEIKMKLMRGQLDVVIGTHALLSNSIHIKNLGLLVVDEEQRFGVKHKEAIKKMRRLVDVMTLSATPIPRTLHMSMIGIRDLSIIQTPPAQRRPVQTYVLEDNDTLIAQAIRREVDRGGQIFYLHNRVQTIDSLALRLQQLLPDITIDTLHGQMNEDEIEDKLVRFVEKKYDVLVTTTIIENGIDMPNVNTLIVDRADTFGLSQLYQIRGRVGRSDRQAYAYFLYNPGRALTELASKRLNTILEYQELGSGFKVSMRDLEIRGAGNMLGKEQSGQIVEVGYEMYINLLENAVKRLRGEPTHEDHRCALNLKTDFYIPADYIIDTKQRISFYKRFESAISEVEVNKLASEMQDRYGRLPKAALIFADVERIRAMASRIGFEKVYELESGIVELATGKMLRVEINHLVSCMQSTKGLSIKPGNANILQWESINDENKLSSLSDALRKIVEPLVTHDNKKSSDDSRHGVGIQSK